MLLECRGVQQGSVADLSGKIGSGHILLAVDGEYVQGKTLDAVAALVQVRQDTLRLTLFGNAKLGLDADTSLQLQGPPKSTITLSLQHATGKYLVSQEQIRSDNEICGSLTLV